MIKHVCDFRNSIYVFRFFCKFTIFVRYFDSFIDACKRNLNFDNFAFSIE